MTRAERFRQARKKTGLNKVQVQMKTGLSRESVEKSESERQVHLDFRFETVYTLAQLYGVDVVWLMKGDEDDS